jgi:hypothetical protein
MVRAGNALATGVVCLGIVLGGSGCGGSSKGKALDPTKAQLQAIGRAYAAAQFDVLDRPPKNKEELIKGLKDMPEETSDPEDRFRSTRDNQEFVIFWDVDLRSIDSRKQRTWPVLAYERQGKDGKRFVLQGKDYVRELPDDEIESLPFPPGHKFK